LGETSGQLYVSPGSTCGNSCSGQVGSPYATIKAALNAYPNGGTIYLTSGTLTGPGNLNLTMSSGDYTISGAGSSKTIIDCQNSGFGFDLFSGDFTLEQFTIQNCVNNNGGGALRANSSYTVLRDVILTGNSAKSQGASIYFFSDTLQIYNSQIYGNNVGPGNAAIYVRSADVQVFNSSINNNNYNLNCSSASIQVDDLSTFGSNSGGLYCYECPITRDGALICEAIRWGTSGLFVFALICLVVLQYILL